MSFTTLDDSQSILERTLNLNWLLILLICGLTTIGLMSLYSAAGGAMDPWASRHLMRFTMGAVLMIALALIDVRIWYRLAWPMYIAGLGLLIAVEVKGQVGMGAQRWINLGFMNLQPSEVMKIAVIVLLARYYHIASADSVRQMSSLIVPLLIIGLPVGLVMLQPDLGTALMIVMGGTAMIFIAGAPLWWFWLAAGLTTAFIPIGWHMLHEYQQKRVLTFINPELDPLGAGYHITQSKIALGSGGMQGKGFLEGTQSRLNFLPEKQTDFIFTLWAEEWGFVGGAVFLALCGLIFAYCSWMAVQCRHNFGRFMIWGLGINFSLYVFINIAMVMGLIPVVGVPLPLVSYGGTAMLTALASFGLMMSAHRYREHKMTGLGGL